MTKDNTLSRLVCADRPSTLFSIPHDLDHCDNNRLLPSDPDVLANCDIEYCEKDCAITEERFKRAWNSYCIFNDRRENCMLSPEEEQTLKGEQKTLRRALFERRSAVSDKVGDTKEQVQAALDLVKAESLEKEEVEDAEVLPSGHHVREKTLKRKQTERLFETTTEREVNSATPPESFSNSIPNFQDRRGISRVNSQLWIARLRARLNKEDDGVLGIQCTNEKKLRNSLMGNNFLIYNMGLKNILAEEGFNSSELPNDLSNESEDKEAEETTIRNEEEEEEKEEETQVDRMMDVEDISYVRKPNLARILEEYQAMANHPRYTLKQVVLSRRFHLYAHRFANCQYQKTLVYPTLPQPKEMFIDDNNPDKSACPWLCGECHSKEAAVVTEKVRTRKNGHRFIIAADTQFGILMDGFAMDYPNWSQEIEISRKCVAQINAMHGDKRPLFVCVCGDLVDTESSFSGAIASWKKVMKGWERNLVFEQQVKDFKRVWSGLDPDIALVCLCGNHDVGNKPTRASIQHWTDSFGDDHLSFWANGTFNLCLNNCLFSNPTGAPDLFAEQLDWMERKLKYARDNDATHIFVYGHFPWFLTNENEPDDFLTSYSAAPEGWGPPGSRFADSYFTVPYEQRKIAMSLFQKYDVTACFSGHFHQNVIAQTSWGMPMIVTGPLSMNLNSSISKELSGGETNGIGMRIVDVGVKKGEFTHKWTLLDDEDELYESAIERCLRHSFLEETEKEDLKRVLSGFITLDIDEETPS